MSTYDSRSAAVEKDVTISTQDIIDKLDETNRAIMTLKEMLEDRGRDIKYLLNQMKSLDFRFNGVETLLEGSTQEVRTIQEQQNVQGQDIKDIKRRLDGIDQRFDGVDQRFDGVDRRFGGIDQRFISLEERFDRRFASIDRRFGGIDQRFEQALQVLANLTNKP